MENLDCPLGVVKKGRRLASQVEAQELPADYHPAHHSWDLNVRSVAREYTNHAALSDQLEDWLIEASERSGHPCELHAPQWGVLADRDCPECPNLWLAHQELDRAARAAAERAYRNWLARKALARRRGTDGP